MHEGTPQIGASPDAGSYEIRLSGRLDARWAAWFDGMSVSADGDGTTVVSGPIADQAALHGILQRVRDLGLPLISVERLVPATPDSPPDPPRMTRSSTP